MIIKTQFIKLAKEAQDSSYGLLRRYKGINNISVKPNILQNLSLYNFVYIMIQKI
jgi:hypothetical protein